VAAAPRVLLIAGWSRSGSTIIDMILGATPGVAAVGELRGLWSKLAYGTGSACGCGRPLRSCPFWSAVVARAFGELDATAARRIAMAEGRHVRTRPGQLAGILAGAGAARRYGTILGRTYRGIADVAGAGTVVDSSKSPAHVLEVAEHAGLDVRVLHLVRDPRAIAHSWLRRSIETFEFSPAASSANWLVMNASVEVVLRRRLGDRMRSLRYEDFAADPRGTLGDVAEWAGIPAGTLPFLDASRVELGGNHTVGGNPGRFTTGPVAIVADEEWRTAMARRAVVEATVPAAPLLGRYGYPLVPRG
jgi:sulfotransferase family protein